MPADEDKVLAAIGEFLTRAGKPDTELTADLSLYGDGLALDSLEVAELSAVLEDTFGTDPFSTAAEMPGTIGQVTAFYRA